MNANKQNVIHVSDLECRRRTNDDMIMSIIIIIIIVIILRVKRFVHSSIDKLCRSFRVFRLGQSIFVDCRVCSMRLGLSRVIARLLLC